MQIRIQVKVDRFLIIIKTATMMDGQGHGDP